MFVNLIKRQFAHYSRDLVISLLVITGFHCSKLNKMTLCA